MIIEDLIRKTRSCRRFYQNSPVSPAQLDILVNLARLSASAANLQPLKYILSSQPKMNEEIFACLSWAEYLVDWKCPEEGERPTAYIIILGDTGISANLDMDTGIAAQSIMLGAREAGLGGCIISTINKEKLRASLNISPHLTIQLALAFGKPKESIAIESIKNNGDVRYWRDEKCVLHVPKRDMNDIIIGTYF